MNDILETLNAVKADFKAAEELVAELQGEKETFTSTLSDKEAALTAALETIGAKDALIAELQESLTAKDAEIASLGSVIATLKSEQVTAEAKAVEIVAAQGIAPITVDRTAETGKLATREEALAEYASLKGAKDKAAFWEAHKAILIGR